VEGINNQLLIGATDLSLDILIGYIHQFDDWLLRAHRRESFSVLSQLGFIDDNAGFDALEITHLTGFDQARIKYQNFVNIISCFLGFSFYKRYRTGIHTNLSWEPSFAELKMAFKKQNGRCVNGATIMLDLAAHILDIAENSVRAGARLIESISMKIQRKILFP